MKSNRFNEIRMDIKNQVIDMVLDDYEDKTIEQAIKNLIKRNLEKVREDA